MRWFWRRDLLATSVVGLIVCSLLGCTTATPSAPTSAPPAAAPTSAAAKPASSPSPSAVGSLSAAALNPAAARPANATLKISAPTAGQSMPAGSIQVMIDYNGPTLVPAANSTKLDDLHLHYFLDESATPYLGTGVPVPAGNPRIIHTAALQQAFDNVTAGSHTVVVMLSGNNHVSVN